MDLLIVNGLAEVLLTSKWKRGGGVAVMNTNTQIVVSV